MRGQGRVTFGVVRFVVIDSLTHSPARSVYNQLFIYSLTHLFIVPQLFIHSLIYCPSVTDSLTHSFIVSQLFIHSLTHLLSFSYSFTHSLIYCLSVIHSLTHSSVAPQLIVHLPTRLLTRLLNSHQFTHLLTCQLTHLLNRSYSYSFIYSVTCWCFVLYLCMDWFYRFDLRMGLHKYERSFEMRLCLHQSLMIDYCLFSPILRSRADSLR